jgi:hypothetical protein
MTTTTTTLTQSKMVSLQQHQLQQHQQIQQLQQHQQLVSEKELCSLGVLKGIKFSILSLQQQQQRKE